MSAIVEDALDADRVVLAFQPIVAAGDWNRTITYEALIRLIDVDGRTIPAAEFIEEVEATDLGRRIDSRALTLAIAELRRDRRLRLTVNMSACSIRCPDWTRILDRMLATDADFAERLVIEITESAAIASPAELADFMAHYQGRGVRFALDDFGSGYTSMRYLKSFHFDILKIDGEFVRDLAGNADNRALVAIMVSLGQHFEMTTVAEKVETVEEAKILRDLGVDRLQGYCFGAPDTALPKTGPAPEQSVG